MLINQLIRLGFTPTVAAVYLFLVQKGVCGAGEVIAETKLPRSAVYAALEQLVGRELVSRIQGRGVARFRLNNPDHLVVEAEAYKKRAEELVGELQRERGAPPREVMVYEGLDGIKRAVDKHLLTLPGETIYFLGPSKFGEQESLESYWAAFHRTRFKKQLSSKILYDRSTGPKVLNDRNGLPNSRARYLPFGLHLPMWFAASGEYLSIVVPGEEPFLVFSIRSRAAAEGIKKYFEYLWSQGGQTAELGPR